MSANLKWIVGVFVISGWGSGTGAVAPLFLFLVLALLIDVVNGHQLTIGSGKAVCATVDDMEVIGVSLSNGCPFGETFKFARKIVQF